MNIEIITFCFWFFFFFNLRTKNVLFYIGLITIKCVIKKLIHNLKFCKIRKKLICIELIFQKNVTVQISIFIFSWFLKVLFFVAVSDSSKAFKRNFFENWRVIKSSVVFGKLSFWRGHCLQRQFIIAGRTNKRFQHSTIYWWSFNYLNLFNIIHFEFILIFYIIRKYERWLILKYIYILNCIYWGVYMLLMI